MLLASHQQCLHYLANITKMNSQSIYTLSKYSNSTEIELLVCIIWVFNAYLIPGTSQQEI